MAFLYWLREHAGGRGVASHLRFAQLLGQLAAGDELDGALAATHDGRSFSEGALDDSVLEGRFLVWLSKQR